MTEATAGLVDRATIERLPRAASWSTSAGAGWVPLWALEDVLVTAHSAAQSARENERITQLFVASLRRYLDGEPLVTVVEPGGSSRST